MLSYLKGCSKYRPASEVLWFLNLARGGHQDCQVRQRNPYFDPYHEMSVRGAMPRSLIGKRHTVTMAKGVGVGPELMDIVKRVLLVANAPIDFEEHDMGADSSDTEMDNLVYSIERNGVAIKWNIEQHLEPTEISRNMQLRRALDLYINLIEIKSYPGLANKTRLRSMVDVVLVRQNTEGEFAMLEHDNGKGIEHLKITTAYNSKRLAQYAFDYARKFNRRKVTVVYNKGFMNDSEAVFVEAVADVATKNPDIPFTRQSMRSFANNMCNLGYNGDVMVTSVLYGGIIMNLLLGMMHSTSLYCGQNMSNRYAVFEPSSRNKGLKFKGKDLANPVAVLACAVKMLRYLKHNTSADVIERAINLTINDDKVHTQDIVGGTATTSEMVRNIERRIREVMPEGFCDEKPPPLAPAPAFKQLYHSPDYKTK